MFQFERQLYQFACLPNKLSSTSRLFTKVLKPIFAAVHKNELEIMSYLDDSILIGDTFEECKSAVLLLQELCHYSKTLFYSILSYSILNRDKIIIRELLSFLEC